MNPLLLPPLPLLHHFLHHIDTPHPLPSYLTASSSVYVSSSILHHIRLLQLCHHHCQSLLHYQKLLQQTLLLNTVEAAAFAYCCKQLCNSKLKCNFKAMQAAMEQILPSVQQFRFMIFINIIITGGIRVCQTEGAMFRYV